VSSSHAPQRQESADQSARRGQPATERDVTWPAHVRVKIQGLGQG
jgi:hypothetical protein